MSDTASMRSRVLRGLLWTGGGHVVGQVFWLGSLVVLGVILPPLAFGTVATGMAVVGVASLLMGAGTQGSIVAAPELTRRMALGALALNVANAVGLTILGVLFAGPVLELVGVEEDLLAVRVLLLSVVVHAFAILPVALLTKHMEFGRRAAASTTSAVVGAIVAVVAAALGAGVWALVLRLVVRAVVEAALLWVAARGLVPPRAPGARRGLDLQFRRPAATAFFVLAVSQLIAMSLDNLVVGAFVGPTELGLYAFAFTMAFAPLTQFSWQVGSVFFASSAASTLEESARRFLTALRLSALVLLPTIVPAVLLAPVVLPRLLGAEWEGAVVVFQLLFVVGIAHGLLNVLGEFLSGSGGIGFRARASAVWAVGTLAAVALLVHLDGIRGAALAHLLAFVPLGAAYLVRGTRVLELDGRAVLRELHGVAEPVGAQVAASIACVVVLRLGGADADVAALVAVVVVLAALAGALVGLPAGPLVEVRDLLGARRRRLA